MDAQLEIDLEKRILNGSKVHRESNILGEVQALAHKTKFTSIKIRLARATGKSSLSATDLVAGLSCSAWSDLREIGVVGGAAMKKQLGKFIGSLGHLPALRKCDIQLNTRFAFFERLNYRFNNHDDDDDEDDDDDDEDEFESIMTALFNSPVNITLSCDDECFFRGLHNCQIVELVQQLQKEHKELAVDFVVDFKRSDDPFLKLTLGSSSFQEPVSPSKCDESGAMCIDCPSFYPTVLKALVRKAELVRSYHVHFHWLNLCKVGRVVADLNAFKSHWKALSAVVDVEEDEEANETITIRFKTNLNGRNRKFKLSVGYGPCFSESCTKCCPAGEGDEEDDDDDV